MAFLDSSLGNTKLLDNISSNISAALQWLESSFHHFQSMPIFENFETFILTGSSDAFQIPYLMLMFRNLETFILCVRKLGNDMHMRIDDETNNSKKDSLGSLLVKIEAAVCRNSWEGDLNHLLLQGTIQHFVDDFNSFRRDIQEWFLQLSIYPTTTTHDELIDISDSVVKNLVHDMDYMPDPEVFFVNSLINKIQFHRNLIRFAKLQCVEQQQLQDFVNHALAVALNAAPFALIVAPLEIRAESAKFTSIQKNGMIKEELSSLVQRIKPIHPDVYATYTQALISSKLSRQLPAPIPDIDGDTIIIRKYFIDSLICNLWQMLQLHTSPVISIRDQLQLLLAGLRSLRTTYVKQQNKFDVRIKDVTGVLICDAGHIIFSLYQKDVKAEFELLHWLERIEHFRREVEDKDPEASTSNFSQTFGLCFIDYLIQYLMDSTGLKPAGSNSKTCALTIKEQLVFVRKILEEIVDMHNEVKEFHALWNRVLQVADRVESFIDLLLVDDLSHSLSVLFDSIIKDIGDIRTDATMIIPVKGQDIKGNQITNNSSLVPSQSSPPETDDIVGFTDESTSIIDSLTKGLPHLRIIAIVGMVGQGKTTLATKVYSDPRVMLHFHVRALCSISQVFDKRKVLLELLNLDENTRLTEHDLAEKFKKHLLGNRYLIFLDDVWDIQVWNSLAESLPDDSNGSRIILTSRLCDVVPPAILDSEGPLLLRELNKDESWELLQRKLFQGNDCPPELYEIGIKIAESCKGLPLTIVIVAGLLANIEHEKWNKILESLSSGILSTTVQCTSTLELSYKHLPDYLKPCFLYFGMFPEDQVISTKRLIWLWIAEGFVQKTNKSTSIEFFEDVARDYLMDLISRSLVLVAKRNSTGGVKACRVHDLLHDFSRTKAKAEHFSRVLCGFDALSAFNAPRNLRRLGIQSKLCDLRESRLVCPSVRSLIFLERSIEYGVDTSFVIHIFKLLKVLDIGKIHLGTLFPSEIGFLVQLRYLAVWTSIQEIPSSIGNLSFLETFILDIDIEMVSFPATFWDLRKLRHLCVRMPNGCGGFSFGTENLENFPDLCELESCLWVIIFSWESMGKQLKKFPNVRKLKCLLFKNLDDFENCNKIVVPDFLSRLESLSLSPCLVALPRHFDVEFGLPVNLKKLTLSGFTLSGGKISSFGKLPNLQVLKLLSCPVSGETWDMEEGEFSRLQFLKLYSLPIVRWTASEYQFPHLQKLVVEFCSDLVEVPSYALEHTYTLEMIQLRGCPSSLTSLFKQNQEDQMNKGNSDFKFLVENEIQ